MHFIIVADAFPPMRTSAAVMLSDLANELIAKSHIVSAIVPSFNQRDAVSISGYPGLKIFSVKAFKTKDVGYLQRTLAELVNPLVIWARLKSQPEFKKSLVDGIIWYSPTIFWGPLIKRLKSFFNCDSYLILRDVFPDWALDLEVLNKGFAYYFFKKIALYQYHQADTIGVQSPNNLKYFIAQNPLLIGKTEVLWNWLRPPEGSLCSIEINKTPLAGKKIGIYAGNIGVAQGIKHFLTISRIITEDPEFGLIFIGRGKEMQSLKDLVEQENLPRIIFFDEIASSEISHLYSQCHFGLLILDHRHQTHNIPGKFISYLFAYLPTFGLVNKGNDLLEKVNKYSLGMLIAEYSPEEIRKSFTSFKNQYLGAISNFDNYKKIQDTYFSSSGAAHQIISHFQ